MLNGIEKGDIVYTKKGEKVRITFVSDTKNGFGFEYLDGEKQGWIDFAPQVQCFVNDATNNNS